MCAGNWDPRFYIPNPNPKILGQLPFDTHTNHLIQSSRKLITCYLQMTSLKKSKLIEGLPQIIYRPTAKKKNKIPEKIRTRAASWPASWPRPLFSLGWKLHWPSESKALWPHTARTKKKKKTAQNMSQLLDILYFTFHSFILFSRNFSILEIK